MTRERLEEFADCLLVGVFLAITALPVVTAPSGFAAACAVLADRRTPLLNGYLAALRDRWRAPGAELLVGVVFAVLLLDVLLATTLLPGGVPLRLAVLAAAVGGLTLLAGIAARAGTTTWRAAARGGFAARGLVLLAGAVVAAGVLVWALPPLALVIGGPLAVAASTAVGR
jgi:hypothetical protein